MTQWTRSCNATRSTTSNLWKLGTLIALWTSATDDGFLRKNRSKQPPASIVQPALVPKRPFSTHEDLKEIKIRSSRPEVFLGESVLKICSKFTGGHPCRSAISIKLQINFTEITLRHGCYPVNLLHIFRTPFSMNTSGWLLLINVWIKLVTVSPKTILNVNIGTLVSLTFLSGNTRRFNCFTIIYAVKRFWYLLLHWTPNKKNEKNGKYWMFFGSSTYTLGGWLTR